jgi:hypothetical protein
MAQFSERMVGEVVQVFWAAIQRGESLPTLRLRSVPIGCEELDGCGQKAGSARVVAGI